MSFLWMLQQAVLLAGLNLARRVVRSTYRYTGVVSWKLYGRIIFKLDDHSRHLTQGFSRSRETIALKQPAEMDAHALALDALYEDHELEQFIAGFYRSSAVQAPDVALKHITKASTRHWKRASWTCSARVVWCPTR
ncbi:hypothetical protein BJV78DRAFT_1283167 [Lactifluus subvellereus]|nr:hypothetical protein BJV78DRAFT_1283167 [Lactifluus subvellereus]